MRMGVLRRPRGGESRNDDGAALAEFAILMPLLVLLLLGMIEFGWAFAQQIDVRHKAREALRLVVVDAPFADVQGRVCNDDIVKSDDITDITITTGPLVGSPPSNVGSPASTRITADLNQITGLFGVFWGATPQITSEVEGRVEQVTTNAYVPSDPANPCAP